jgi:hypothetical protein
MDIYNGEVVAHLMAYRAVQGKIASTLYIALTRPKGLMEAAKHDYVGQHIYERIKLRLKGLSPLWHQL